MAELLKPGEPLDPQTKAFMAALWLKTLAEIGEARFDEAFGLVVENSTFRPDIAEIRKAAGLDVTIRNPKHEQAMAEFRLVLSVIRVHGKELKPTGGGLLRDDNGELVYGIVGGVMQRQMTLPPALPDSSERALERLGGTREAGLAVLATHPSVTPCEQPQFMLQAIKNLENKWCEVWG